MMYTKTNEWMFYSISTSDRNAQLYVNPYYTDSRFREPQTIFGEREDGLSYEYDDRIQQWDYQKHKDSWEVAKQDNAVRTANFYSAYLSAYHDRKIEVVHILAGVNLSNGYPYLVFGYKEATS